MLDFSSIFSQLAPPFIFLIIMTLIIGFLKSAYFKGKIGETLIDITNNLRLDKSIYKSLSNVTIKLNDGSTTQIDHIIVSKFGIFVIETKNMKGWIFGSEHQKRWTQNIYGKKHTFQNPLHQNYRHIKAIKELLNMSSNIYSIVSFVGECKFKTTMPNNIFIGGAYINYIKSFKYTCFTTSKVKEIIDTFENRTLPKSRATDKAHISSLKKNYSASESLFVNDYKITCKRCGNIMVERVNKKTKEKFLGCSNYPRCKNTEKID